MPEPSDSPGQLATHHKVAILCVVLPVIQVYSHLPAHLSLQFVSRHKGNPLMLDDFVKSLLEIFKLFLHLFVGKPFALQIYEFMFVEVCYSNLTTTRFKICFLSLSSDWSCEILLNQILVSFEITIKNELQTVINFFVNQFEVIKMLAPLLISCLSKYSLNDTMVKAHTYRYVVEQSFTKHLTGKIK